MSTHDDFPPPPPGAFSDGAGFLPADPATDVEFPPPPPDAFGDGAGFLPDPVEPAPASVQPQVPRRPSVAEVVQPESPPFNMVEENFYSHPRYAGLLAVVIFDPYGFFAGIEDTHVACVKVNLPIGGRTLIFPLESLPAGAWLSLTDEEQRTIPLEVYFDGSLQVLGRWT
jgi:hypothetical protein